MKKIVFSLIFIYLLFNINSCTHHTTKNLNVDNHIWQTISKDYINYINNDFTISTRDRTTKLNNIRIFSELININK